MIKKSKNIEIITLGCSKNLVDSEQFHFYLQENGHNVKHNQNFDTADIAIVNTCGFINDAKEESIEVIFNLIHKKNEGKLDKIIVFGCLSERYMRELKQELPEVDSILGNFDIKALISEIGIKNIESPAIKRVLDNPGHYAYLKIAEGCNRKCAFCAIPSFKGKYISRSIDSILHEANYLATNGVKELMLIAQDTSFYGYDLEKKYLLSTLLDELVKTKGIEWIRVHYLYPNALTQNLIDTIAKHDKICSYFDLPLQHISNDILKRMKRNTSKEKIEKLIERIRKTIPNAGLRTSFIVGFPGETKRDFNELINFIKQTRFDRLGAFIYSHEENTYGGKNLVDDISKRTKQNRLEKLMEVQQNISLEINAEKISQTMPVIIDGVENDVFYGRTQHDSVEVDNTVWVDYDADIEIRNIYDIKIYDSAEFDLFGEIAKKI
ncbi:MAG: 30S ribosomal protein S12 methylthiotransferase RimO [Bacteroidales bacterium]|nr:30S ribosomal protein S12 methylthiotransferase RimO [Bacteroidales bacterium]